MKNRKIWIFASLGAAALAALLIHGSKSPPSWAKIKQLTTQSLAPKNQQAPVTTLAPVTIRESEIRAGSTLYEALRAAGIGKPDTIEVIDTLKKLIDPRRLSAGTVIEAYFNQETSDRPHTVDLQLDSLRTLRASFVPDAGWISEIFDTEVTTEMASFSGIVESSLWNSATLAGMDPNIIYQLAEIFAWQVDFNREVQLGDRWRLTVEKRLVDGEVIGYGNVTAAEYENVGTLYSAVRFDRDGSNGRFFRPDGESLRRMFLKSPLKYGRITSGFQANRFHPILGVNRPHLGIDYGAPTGTPVMSVGDGTVVLAAVRGGSGKMVSIRHNGVYQTHY
ncbi:hypothetical protein E3A20_24750, partial [Planctomyces bekefii]